MYVVHVGWGMLLSHQCQDQSTVLVTSSLVIHLRITKN